MAEQVPLGPGLSESGPNVRDEVLTVHAGRDRDQVALLQCSDCHPGGLLVLCADRLELIVVEPVR
jgi:hypothetical protein